jgi:hypothetical protein
MFIELTLIDDDGSQRLWKFLWAAVESLGRNKPDSATLIFTTSGRSYSVVERPEIISEILGNTGSAMQVARAAK